MDGSVTASGAGGLPPPPQIPPAGGGGAPTSGAGNIGGVTPPDSDSKRFNLGSTGGSPGHPKPDPAVAKKMIHDMLLAWIKDSNAASQRWTQSISEDEDSD